jgi:hypothetical protein
MTLHELDIIFFEGVPGSGKSTQAQWLEVNLIRQGHKARWYQEGDSQHPLNWWNVTPDFDWLPYLMDVENTMRHSRDKWRQFTQRARQNNTLTLLEAWPFLNCVSIFVMADASEKALFDYWNDVRQMLAPLNAKLIYFDQPDLRTALMRINSIRGDAWQKQLYSTMERFPFCANRGLVGLDGVVTLWETHQRIIRRMCDDFPGEIHRIDITANSWATNRSKLLGFLNIEADNTPPPVLHSFTGTYASENCQVTISQHHHNLILREGDMETSLVWIGDNQFYYQAVPIICVFDPDGTLHIDSTRCGGETRILNIVQNPL